MRSLKSGEIAFAIVVLAAYVVLFTSPAFKYQFPETYILILLGLAFLAIGLYGERWVAARGDPPLWVGLFFAAQIALSCVIVWLGQGQTWLVPLPLAGMAVAHIRRPWNVITVLAVWAAMVIPFAMIGGLANLTAWGIPFMAAVVFVAVFTQMTVNEEKARKELSEAHQKLREYTSKVEELAVVQERNRLAREIHDGLGHYLTAINIQIKAAQAVAQQDPAASLAALNNAQTLTQEALADVRRSVSSLRAGPVTPQPLPDLLEQVSAEARTAGLLVDLSISGDCRPLPSQVEFTLYRCAQEGLTNIRKHAQATQARVDLEYGEKRVRLQISDNGIGAQDTQGGYGLIGLRERVEFAGGRLSAETAPGQGFHLQVELPV